MLSRPISIGRCVLPQQRLGIRARNDYDLRDAGVDELLDDQLDGWLIDYRNQLLGVSQGHGKHPRSGSRSGDYPGFYFHSALSPVHPDSPRKRDPLVTLAPWSISGRHVITGL